MSAVRRHTSDASGGGSHTNKKASASMIPKLKKMQPHSGGGAKQNASGNATLKKPATGANTRSRSRSRTRSTSSDNEDNRSQSRSRSRSSSRTANKSSGAKSKSAGTKSTSKSNTSKMMSEDDENESMKTLSPGTRKIVNKLVNAHYSRSASASASEVEEEDSEAESSDAFKTMGSRRSTTNTRASPGKTPRDTSRGRGANRQRSHLTSEDEDAVTEVDEESDALGSEDEDQMHSSRSQSRSRSHTRASGRSVSQSSGSGSSTQSTPVRRTTTSNAPKSASTQTNKTPSTSNSKSAPGTGVLSTIATSISKTPLGTLFRHEDKTPVYTPHRPYTRAMELSEENSRLTARLSHALDDMKRKVSELLKGHEGACDEHCIDRSAVIGSHREGYFPSSTVTSSSSSMKAHSMSPMRTMGADDRAGLDNIHQAFAVLALLAAAFTWTNYSSHLIDIIPRRYPTDNWSTRMWKGLLDFFNGHETHSSAFANSPSGAGNLTYHFFYLSILFSSFWLMTKLFRQANLRSRIVHGYWVQALPIMIGCFIAYALGCLTLGPAVMLAIAGVISRAWPVTYIHTFADHAMAAFGFGTIFILSSWYGFHDINRMTKAGLYPKTLVQGAFATPLLSALSWELVFFSATCALIMANDLYRKMPWLSKYVHREDGSFYSTWASCLGMLFILTLVSGGVAVPSFYFMISELLMAFPRAPGTTPSYMSSASPMPTASMSSMLAPSATKMRTPGGRSLAHDIPSPSHRIR